MAFVHRSFAKPLAIILLALFAVVLVPVAAGLDVPSQHSAPADCPSHSDESDSACPCCPDDTSGDSCAERCALQSAIVSEWRLEVNERSWSAIRALATATRTRTDVPPNPPPIR